MNLRNILIDTKAIATEIVGLLGGILWGMNEKWEYEAIILIVVSALALLISLFLKWLPDETDRPLVELEFSFIGASVSPPGLIENISPKSEDGGGYIIEKGGIYLFTIRVDYYLILRNNSKNNALGLKLHKVKDSYKLNFIERYNSLDALIIDKPKTLRLNCTIRRPMTHDEADLIANNGFPDELRSLEIIAEYKNEAQKMFYTKFKLPVVNETLKKKPELSKFEVI